MSAPSLARGQQRGTPHWLRSTLLHGTSTGTDMRWPAYIATSTSTLGPTVGNLHNQPRVTWKCYARPAPELSTLRRRQVAHLASTAVVVVASDSVCQHARADPSKKCKICESNQACLMVSYPALCETNFVSTAGRCSTGLCCC